MYNEHLFIRVNGDVIHPTFFCAFIYYTRKEKELYTSVGSLTLLCQKSSRIYKTRGVTHTQRLDELRIHECLIARVYKFQASRRRSFFKNHLIL